MEYHRTFTQRKNYYQSGVFNMKNILITGGAGYIGSVLTETLLNRGYKVTVVDLFDQLESSLSYAAQYKNFSAKRLDVLDAKKLREFCTPFDVIIPLAALVGAPLCERHEVLAELINYKSIANILETKKSDQLIIYPNTNSGYGKMTDNEDFCTEESPLNPISVYGETKVRAEKDIINSGGIAFRLATVFGSSYRMRTDLMVNEFVYKAVKEKCVVLFESHFRRNFIHVRDVCKAFIHAIENSSSMSGEVYNLGLSSANYTKKQLCLKIKEQVKSFVIIENDISLDPDKRDYLVSNEKLEATGWSPDHSIESGIAELIKYYETFAPIKTANV